MCIRDSSRLPVVHFTTHRPHLPLLPELFELRADRRAAARGRARNLARDAAGSAVPPVGSRRSGRRATCFTGAGSARTPALETPDTWSSVRTDTRSSTDDRYDPQTDRARGRVDHGPVSLAVLPPGHAPGGRSDLDPVHRRPGDRHPGRADPLVCQADPCVARHAGPLARAAGDPEEVPVSYTHLRAHETRHDLVCR